MPRRKITERYSALSLGWGVQSFTLVAMMALGVIPKVDVVLNADTEHEREHTYEFAERWTPWLIEHGVNVVTLVTQRKYTTQPSIPENKQCQIPAFTTTENGKGRVNRQCTEKWKIAPIKKYLKDTRLGRPVDLIIGISLDEARRANGSGLKYITHHYPLIDMEMTRQDCIDWLTANNLEVPGKSSCVFCPFLNLGTWLEMKEENGPDWKHAVEVDEEIRDVRPPLQFFVHPSRLPLTEAVAEYEKRFDNNDGTDKLYLDAECGSGYCFI